MPHEDGIDVGILVDALTDPLLPGVDPSVTAWAWRAIDDAVDLWQVAEVRKALRHEQAWPSGDNMTRESMLRLPSPELVELLNIVKREVVGMRCSAVDGIELRYAVFHPGPDTSELGACYDQEGTVYVPEDLVALDERFADLIALHEYVEVQHKRARRPHAYAHRRALVQELLAAKRIFAEAAGFRHYVEWRIGLYPAWKIPDSEQIVAQLMPILTEDRPRKGQLFHVIEEHRL